MLVVYFGRRIEPGLLLGVKVVQEQTGWGCLGASHPMDWGRRLTGSMAQSPFFCSPPFRMPRFQRSWLPPFNGCRLRPAPAPTSWVGCLASAPLFVLLDPHFKVLLAFVGCMIRAFIEAMAWHGCPSFAHGCLPPVAMSEVCTIPASWLGIFARGKW